MSEFLRKFAPIIIMIGMGSSIYWLKTLEQKETIEYKLEGQTMGTTYHITYKFIRGDKLDEVIKDDDLFKKEVDDLLVKINKQMSTYDSNSEISQINSLEDITQSITISPEFAEVLAASREVHQTTAKAFDITVGPLVNLWGFGPKGERKEPPTSKEIAQAKSLVGMNKWKVTQDTQGQYSIKKDQVGVYLDLSGIAKGYGVDKIAELLEHYGIQDYLVDIGGELRVKGTWNVAIEEPNPKTLQSVQKIIPLSNMSIATSGTYRNFFKSKDKTFSHEIKPETGDAAVGKILSISVLDKECMVADGLATGFINLGLQETLDISEAKNIPVYIIALSHDQKTIEFYSSSEFKRLFEGK